MEQSEVGITPGVYVGAGVGVLGTFIFLGIHLVGAVMWVQASSPDKTPPSKLALAAWLTSALGAFMGPCVIFMNVIALILGVLTLRDDPSPRSSVCAKTAIAASIEILLMTAAMIAIVLASLP